MMFQSVDQAGRDLLHVSEEECAQMQDVLQRITGQRTVPNVYINKMHVGGCTDTQKALADGTLDDMVKGIYRKYDFDYVVIGGGSGGLASAKVNLHFYIPVSSFKTWFYF